MGNRYHSCSGSGLVWCLLGYIDRRRRFRQVRDNEQRYREGSAQWSTSDLLQQQGTASLQGWIPRQSLALHAQVWVSLTKNNDLIALIELLYITLIFAIVDNFRVVDEDCYPWLGGKSDKCKVPRRGKLSDAGCRRRNSYNLRNEMYKVGPAYRLGNETDVMQEILTSGPVQGKKKLEPISYSFDTFSILNDTIFTQLPCEYTKTSSTTSQESTFTRVPSIHTRAVIIL